jgi:CheY-like chemotaxis protein
MRILIAEDSSITRLLLRGMLESDGLHQIIEAEDGLLAWNLLQDGPVPDLCILDIMMPQMNGLEVLRRVREDPRLKDIHVILCSLVNNRQVITHAAKLGIQGYLLKPFQQRNIDDLLRKVELDSLMVAVDSPKATAERLGVAMDSYFVLFGCLIKETGRAVDCIQKWAVSLVPAPEVPAPAPASPDAAGAAGENSAAAQPPEGDAYPADAAPVSESETVEAVPETAASTGEEGEALPKPDATVAEAPVSAAPVPKLTPAEAAAEALTNLKGSAQNLGARNLLGPIARLESVVLPAGQPPPEPVPPASDLQIQAYEVVSDALNDLHAEKQRLTKLMHILEFEIS